jgi:uncharacterized protein YgiM (DUF1202 family)
VSRNAVRALRAVAGLALLVVLLVVVSGWWKDYREAPSDTQKPSTPSQSSPSDSGQGSDKPAETSPADKATAETDTLVVLVDGLNLRIAPQSDAKNVRGLNKGEKLVLLKKDEKWYEVETAEGDTGWISSDSSYTRVEKR